MNDNERQDRALDMDAHVKEQHTADDIRSNYINNLPKEAKEKLEKIESIANELNELGVPYYYLTLVPTYKNSNELDPDFYSALFYNNLVDFYKKDPATNSYINREILTGLLWFLGNARGNLETSPDVSPIQRGLNIIWAAIQEVGNPKLKDEVNDSIEKGFDALNEIFGLDLEPKLLSVEDETKSDEV